MEGARARAGEMRFARAQSFCLSATVVSGQGPSPGVFWEFRHVERVLHQSPARNGHGRRRHRHGDARYADSKECPHRRRRPGGPEDGAEFPRQFPKSLWVSRRRAESSGRSRTSSHGASAANGANAAAKRRSWALFTYARESTTVRGSRRFGHLRTAQICGCGDSRTSFGADGFNRPQACQVLTKLLASRHGCRA